MNNTSQTQQSQPRRGDAAAVGKQIHEQWVKYQTALQRRRAERDREAS